MEYDTIAAIASGLTASGIGIIRISGPEAFLILSRLFRPRRRADVGQYRANTIHYGHIVTSGEEHEGEVVDECLVSIFRAPYSYTAEDTVEIHTHGGPFVMQRVLDLVLKSGARAAEPGEFTKRAFLNGRMDLSEAEAVMDVIHARSADALAVSERQLSGSVRKAVSEIRSCLLTELARIEAALDDPEHYDLTGYGDELQDMLSSLRERLSHMAASFLEGRLIRDGILTVIVGKPNAGKSSLLNALTGEERAIVTEIEGTTRDTLEEHISLGGLSLRVIDTAGIREARDRIEQIGIVRARDYAERADLLLAMFDSARELDENDRQILELIHGRRAVILLNKSDLPGVIEPEALKMKKGLEDIPVVQISARERSGLDLLEREIRRMFFSGHLPVNEETMITNARHKQAIDAAIHSLDLVSESIAQGLPEDFYSIDLMDACKRLGEITGEDVGEDLVNMIFSKFCMGK